MTPEIEEIIEQNKSLKDQLANLSTTHAKDRQRLDELLSDYVRDKKALADALGTDPIHWDMKREVEALKREAADWRDEHVRREAAEPTVASTYTKSYVSAPFGTEDAPLELVTLKRGLEELAVIPASLLREMFAELRPLLDSENVKEHAPLSARARVDHGVNLEITEEHVNRAADRGCCVSACSASYFWCLG